MRLHEIKQKLPIKDMKVYGYEFTLPTSIIHYLDDPTKGIGDDGWDMEELENSIRSEGIHNALVVGKSIAEMERGNNTIFAWNGNHRLAIAKKLKIPMVRCENNLNHDDAEPLSVGEIEALGGNADECRKYLISRGYR